MHAKKRRARPAVVILVTAIILVVITVLVFLLLGYRYISTEKGIKFLGKAESGQPIIGLLKYPNGMKARLDFINSSITYENGDLYTGGIDGVYRDGKGTMQYSATGDIYVGDFTADEMTGSGVYTYSNGDRYEGSLLDGKMSGKGLMTFRGGSIYDGNFVNGMRSGYGVYTWASGARYEGTFDEDVKNGYGKMTYANGDYFDGQFVDDKRHGKGTYIWAGEEDIKESYTGSFVNNLIDTRILKSDGSFETKADGSLLHGEMGRYVFAGTGKPYVGYFEAGKVVGEDFNVGPTQ
ncbi:MAG TPA: hypothetical protein DD733_02235 [Clostridiales bacterium]|nr:hypothetical protein [Clostridiales bacterium]